MPEPTSLIVSTISAAAFTSFLEPSAGEAAKKFTPLIPEKEDITLS